MLINQLLYNGEINTNVSKITHHFNGANLIRNAKRSSNKTYFNSVNEIILNYFNNKLNYYLSLKNGEKR